MENEGNKSAMSISAAPEQPVIATALTGRFRDRLRTAHALVAIALLGVASLPEAAHAQTSMPPIVVVGTPPSGGGGFGGGGGDGGANYSTGCSSAGCEGDGSLSGYQETVVNSALPAPSTLSCGDLEELRLAEANGMVQRPLSVSGFALGTLVWGAREGDLFLTITSDGREEAWEFLCGGRFCAGTVLNASPKYSACN